MMRSFHDLVNMYRERNKIQYYDQRFHYVKNSLGN